MATQVSLNQVEKEITACQQEAEALQKELDALEKQERMTFADRMTFSSLKERFARLQDRVKFLAKQHKEEKKELAKQEARLAELTEAVKAKGEPVSEADQLELDALTARIKALKGEEPEGKESNGSLPESTSESDPIESQIENVRRIKRKLDMNLPLSESEAESMNGFLETFRTMVQANAPELLRRRALTILLDRAMTESTITYEDLARQIGVPHSGNALGRALTPILTNILNWCQDRGMPPLTALVVRKSGTTAGLPSPTYFQLMGVSAPNKAGKEFLKKLHDSHLADIRQFFSLALTQTK